MNSSIYDRIVADIKDAMKDGDTVKRDCLRTIVSDVKNMTVNAGKALSDDVVIKCLQKSVKQHKDSIEQFQSAGRHNLAEKEIREVKYLQKYLPQMMTVDETKAAVDLILRTVEAVKKNMGLVMKQLPKEADKKVASQYLNTILK